MIKPNKRGYSSNSNKILQDEMATTDPHIINIADNQVVGK